MLQMRHVLQLFTWIPSFSDVYTDLGMALTFNDDGKLAIPVAYCLQVLKKSNIYYIYDNNGH